ncbi:ATP-binding protein [Leadbettera azotonutricia]|uniref:Uncharacterized protein n=1 Tax=Leadbettera azotonutricia (strain ATCC BAA-888 / DSM 13862 / ZAS-9) TaxID=545695 RepID=F5Y944_LEAAZ|nr:ATP-binding protein [Leadbettera azotonutricia]AEF80286.1 conserved hypothetical protein [Leadbettera azotonutricia ZAS-9]
MYSMYFLAPFRELTTFIFALAVIVQCFRLFLLFTAHEKSTFLSRKVFETASLFYLFFWGAAFTIFLEYLNDGIFLTLPFTGQFLNSYPFFLFIVFSNALLAVSVFYRCYHEVKQRPLSINRLSVKETIDHMGLGVLYADLKGRPVLVNSAMRSILVQLGLKGNINLGQLREQLTQGIALGDTIKLSFSSDTANSTSSHWLFSFDIISVNGRRYTQVLAADITEEEELNRQIDKANHTLQEQSEHITLAIDQIEETEKAKALLHAKMDLHDRMGQSIALLGQALAPGGGGSEKMETLRPLIAEFTALASLSGDSSAEATIQESEDLLPLEKYRELGIGMHIEGNEAPPGRLPPLTHLSGNAAAALSAILRECITNAVRHAGARNIFARIEEKADALTVKITNDGPLGGTKSKDGALPFHEGTGIQGMRFRAAQAGGEVTIEQGPPFTVIINVPIKELRHD